MADMELGAAQERFADLIWEQELKWKKPTTYTVLRKLCEKGLLQNEGGVVSARISREDFYSKKSEQIVADSYKGSLPAFVAAFISRKDLTEQEADEIRQMIDAFRKGEKP